MRRLGFSTGALAKGDFRRALNLLRAHEVDVVELSALRINELEPLVSGMPDLDLRGFSFVSIHAPTRFAPALERWVIDCLASLSRFGYPIVVHPDVLFTPALWNEFGD